MAKRLLLLPLTVACLSAASGGRPIYVRHCEPCHGANGSAATTAMGRSFKIRDLRSPEVQKQTDAELIAIISKGRGGRMPAFEQQLGPDKIKRVVAYLRTMKPVDTKK